MLLKVDIFVRKNGIYAVTEYSFNQIEHFSLLKAEMSAKLTSYLEYSTIVLISHED